MSILSARLENPNEQVVYYDLNGITARILADSINPTGCRLVTWLLRYPRFIHSELLTHRAFSRNSAGSRAIPAIRLRDRVEAGPATPVHWGQNKAGMQADTEVVDPVAAIDWWRGAMMAAVHFHRYGEDLGLHKQVVNRVIEPWMMIEVIASATDHANFFHLRNHPDAEPNFRVLAGLMWRAFHDHLPWPVEAHGWHLPMVYPDDLLDGRSEDDLIKISVGRCARVSYLTHLGTRDPAEDIALHDRLGMTVPMHASPFEHQAFALRGRERHGNFEGWLQYRKTLTFEGGPDTKRRCIRCGCWGDNHARACPLKPVAHDLTEEP